MKKRVSLHDVARIADVSVGTVSNYLNDSAPVSLETRRRIQEAIDKLGYRRNELARSLRRSKTKTLGVILPNVVNPFYTAIFDGAEQEAQKQGYTVALGITHYNDSLLEEYIDIFYSKQMDGIVINGYNTYCAEEKFSGIDVPIVVIEPPPDFTLWSTIQIDNVAAAQETVEYLTGLGHRRIAIIAPSSERGFNIRYTGYKLALEAHGIAIDPDLIYEFTKFEPDTIAQGEHALQTLLGRASFSACFAASDMLAIGALRAAKQRGFRVPDDLAIVGFDDIPFAALADPPLTTVSQSQRKMGQTAVQILLQHFAQDQPFEPRHIVIDHELVIRAST